MLVTADEWMLLTSRQRIAGGAGCEIQLYNRGEDAHDLAARRVDRLGERVGRTFRMRETRPGELGEATWRFKSGRYWLWCTLPRHARPGCARRLRVAVAHQLQRGAVVARAAGRRAAARACGARARRTGGRARPAARRARRSGGTGRRRRGRRRSRSRPTGRPRPRRRGRRRGGRGGSRAGRAGRARPRRRGRRGAGSAWRCRPGERLDGAREPAEEGGDGRAHGQHSRPETALSHRANAANFRPPAPYLRAAMP